MATNIYRFLANIRNNPIVNKLIHTIDKTYPSYALGANTPLLNHYLPTSTNFQNKPTTLFFNQQPSDALRLIRRIAQKKSVHRLDKNKKDTPIEFVCYGYQDHDGDIVITNIIVPALVELSKNCNNFDQAVEKLYDYVPSKDLRIDMLANYFDYLRNIDLDFHESIGKKPVALLGTTKPIVEYADNTENCPRFSEIAKSIVPGDVEFNHDFLTGVLTVSPYKIVQTPRGLEYQNGSLECVITDYKLSQNTHLASPNRLMNVTQCVQNTPDGKLEKVEISASSQPLIDFQPQNKNERTL